ncbi:DUF4326 domain-containing protein [Pseudomonas sp.]|uniref:DUF4326 domain-containing protein n=1 Tax=Pseudomonas sp. TaxID=306 RepID=UPI0025DD2375|nr:DUF4326 domain-containing protein [Pseudomonas sp.]
MVGQPLRIHRQQSPGARIPPHTKVVDRPTRWGNPWMVRSDEAGWYVQDTRSGRVARVCSEADARELALIYFEEWARPQAMLVQQQLRGWNLACWCKPPIPCHVDVLLEIANTGLRYEAA